ncbi:pentatricopeptide repeat-containing protein [Striga asiatica]|uniref:Pentatricopeptide repeat-containing protein n=1 Tax=Striga asiatica TaxID=4170 RepID=A0A5A7NYE8_STRAF|nr:pentatricopeptide repeat-containing protein [Striga asiatica]
MVERHLKNTIARLIHISHSIQHLHQIHSQILTSPNLSSHHRSFLVSRLLLQLCAAASSPLSLPYAARIFAHIPNPSLFAYNAIIRASATESSGRQCFILYKSLLRGGLLPDSITLPFVLKECSNRANMSSGRALHAHSFNLGYESNLYVQNSLITLYTDCGAMDNARKVFDAMPQRDAVSWNSMIISFLRGGELDSALKLFRQMESKKNIITWNSVITGLTQGSRPRQALDIFREMHDKNTVLPDKITVASALSACASLGAIDQGKWVHAYLHRTGLECDVAVMTALVDMYGKCGYVDKATKIFRAICNKDVFAWTAMISVLALNGLGHEALGVFAEMEGSGVRPNDVTFVALLSACVHCGLVDWARWCFDRMERAYGVRPGNEHYACMLAAPCQ